MTSHEDPTPLPGVGQLFAGDIDDKTCANLFHPTSPAAAVVRLVTHGCSRDRHYLYACDECAQHLLKKKGTIACLACVLDRGCPYPVKAVEGRWLS